jgi:vacuolar-type H+-ATPase subunit I/STV1
MNFPAVSRRAIALPLMLALASTVEAAKLYRYRNAEGTVVVDYKVPVEFVGSGYEVLNDEGLVIQIVPRELTEEEQLERDAQVKLEEEALAEQERLREWDESLMLRYSTVADIEDARKRALRDLQIRLAILKGNRRSLKQKVENLQAQAAEIERTGMEVDVERLRSIEALQKEINATDRAILDRQAEIEELEAAYAADIERFEMLLEVVELRRSLSSQR